jgi:hypothetical protein
MICFGIIKKGDYQMSKKIGLIAIAVLVGLTIFGIFAMRRMRSHMMGSAGVQLDLVAVSADGAQISPSAEVTSVTGELPNNSAAQKSGDMIVLLTLNPYPPRAGQVSEFDVTLTDVNGQTIDDATISLNLTMPSMWMPPNQPAAEFTSDGKYAATAPFTMRGAWRIEVVIMRGGEKQSVFFDMGL